ncbi:MAG TPA: oligosaccharide flippase family protein [Bacteroidales bacterium]|nr:oligosaccharide flippase family protein [Bacteroidales bacterium]
MSKLIRNWGYLLLSDFSQSIISFFVFMLLARKLSPEGYGSLNAILALATIFSIFSINLSSNQVIIREVTLHPKATKDIVRKVILIRAVSLVLTIIALVLYILSSGETGTGYITGVSIIVAATMAWDLAESIAFGHFVTKLTTYISIAAGLCWFFVIFLLPVNLINVELVILLYAGIFLIRSIIYLIFSFKRYVIPNEETLGLNLRSILMMSMPFLWIRIMSTFGDQVPILLLKGQSGNTEVGYYALGSRFVMPITVAVSTGLRAMFPFMTKLFREDRERFNRQLSDGFSMVLLFGSTIAMLLTVSSHIWIPMLFGEEYLKSILPFNFQSWLGVLLCFDLIVANVLAATYRQNVLALIMSIDVMIIFPLMYLGSSHGAEGMAVAKLAGTFVTTLYHIVVVMVVMKANLKSSAFLLSCVYFVVMMCVTIFIYDIVLKVIMITLFLGLFLIFKNSPLRTLWRQISHRIKT